MSLLSRLFGTKPTTPTLDANLVPTAFPIQYAGPAAYFVPLHGSGYGFVLEDDGESGYLYVTNEDRSEIFDAMHLFTSPDGLTAEDEIFVVWSASLRKAGLYYRDEFRAVVDFAEQRACCRTGAPPPDRSWCRSTHDWDRSMAAGLEG